MDKEQATKEEAPSAASTVLMAGLILLVMGGAGYLFFTNVHELSMMMLGQMRSGYEAFLYQRL